jgi:hypothetical protein
VVGGLTDCNLSGAIPTAQSYKQHLVLLFVFSRFFPFPVLFCFLFFGCLRASLARLFSPYSSANSAVLPPPSLAVRTGMSWLLSPTKKKKRAGLVTNEDLHSRHVCVCVCMCVCVYVCMCVYRN